MRFVGVARIGLFLSVILPCVACDQAAKMMARQTLSDRRPLEFLDGIIRLELVENTGAFLSLGSSLSEPLRSIIFLMLVPFGLAVLAVSLLRSHNVSLSSGFGISLMIGGGLGNLIDRIVNDGAVVDFVSVGLAGLRTGIFNVSDVAIVVGALWVFLGMRDSEGADRKIAAS